MIVEIDYTNYKGERSTRRIIPLGHIEFKATDHHPDKQWVVDAFDMGKQDLRSFAMKDIHSWTPVS